MYEQLKMRGKAYGINFGDVRLLSNSRKSLLVAEYARDIDKNDAFTNAIFKAYFEKGLDIGSDTVIISAAQSIGISEQEVRDALENPAYEERMERNLLEGRQQNIISVPTFIINDQYKVVGAQPEKAFIDIFEMINE